MIYPMKQYLAMFTSGLISSVVFLVGILVFADSISADEITTIVCLSVCSLLCIGGIVSVLHALKKHGEEISYFENIVFKNPNHNED